VHFEKDNKYMTPSYVGGTEQIINKGYRLPLYSIAPLFEVYLDQITRAIKTSNNVRELFMWPSLLMVLCKFRCIINWQGHPALPGMTNGET
jgi:hypothetical protein